MNEPAFIQDVRRYLAVFHKRRGIIMTCVGVSMLVALLYNYTARPVYQATARILIDRSTPKVMPTKDLVDPGVQDFATEYELLRGRALAEKVVEKLELMKTAEFSTGPLMSPWERFQRKFLGRAPEVYVGRDGIPLTPSASALRSRLRIEPLPGGRLVDVRFLAYDPGLASRVANAVCETYIEQARDFRFMSSSEATGWLSDRLREQRAKVEEAEKALLEYQGRHGLAGMTSDKGSGGSEKVASLQAAVLSARMDRIAKETSLSQVHSLPYSQLASLPVVQGSPAVQGLRARLNELQAEQSRLGDTLGEKHPEMVRVRNEIASVQDKIRTEAGNVVRSLESDLRAARAREASLEASVEQAKREGLVIDEKTIAYDALKREVDTSKELYQNLLARAKETGLETEMTSSNVRIMEKAEPPRAPIAPARTRNYQIGLLVGLVLGLGLGLLFEHIDNTIKTPEEVKEQLGVPFLGMVPDVSGKTPQKGAGVPTMALRNPDGPVAEAYRVLRTNLIFSSAEATGRAVVVTSANPGEGKTTTAANLAVALALNGAKVLVVDADLRRPTLHQHFGVGKTPGLSDLIVGRSQASESIHTTRFKGLQLLACGYAAPNPAELLGSASMKQILLALRTCYDWVIVDTPPILAMADTPVLCPLVDGVVMVVAAEATTKPALVRALDQIGGVGGKITGVVLNKVDLKRNSYYYSQYYGEYYRSYYAEGPARRSAGAPAGRMPARRS